MTIKSDHPIRLWRLGRQTTLDELAAAANVSNSYLSMIENRRRRMIDIEILRRIAKITRIPLKDLQT